MPLPDGFNLLKVFRGDSGLELELTAHLAAVEFPADAEPTLQQLLEPTFPGYRPVRVPRSNIKALAPVLFRLAAYGCKFEALELTGPSTVYGVYLVLTVAGEPHLLGYQRFARPLTFLGPRRPMFVHLEGYYGKHVAPPLPPPPEPIYGE